MTTAHRPTFDPARGKAAQAPTRIYHSRMLPAHTKLKFRKRGQGGAADRDDLSTPLASEEREWEREAMKRELLEKEAKHSGTNGKARAGSSAAPLLLEDAPSPNDDAEDEEEKRIKRRKLILEEAQKNENGSDDDERLDEKKSDDSDESESESESEDDDDDEEEDETAELMRELERIKRERALEKEREERVKRAQAENERQEEMTHGNPLLFNDGFTSGAKAKRWDEDVIFKNQAKGLNDKSKNGFINDMLRSDFHRKFMDKYIK
ncbi:Pre-mRNA-splicing factor Cwf15/Cwc15 [Limtongia smithiae]|uniref:Pre-mRNA-splicing factor Cwf15/Cwc15 n=1 Tax=Limtongia smithiae TaxID=1125753 RepID=UPI0034CE6655